MHNYAQINEDGICVGISQSHEKIENNNMVEIKEYSEEYLSKRYQNKVWSEEKFSNKQEKTYESERKEYIKLIEEAKILGEIDEANRLQAKWMSRKESLK